MVPQYKRRWRWSCLAGDSSGRELTRRSPPQRSHGYTGHSDALAQCISSGPLQVLLKAITHRESMTPPTQTNLRPRTGSTFPSSMQILELTPDANRKRNYRTGQIWGCPFLHIIPQHSAVPLMSSGLSSIFQLLIHSSTSLVSRHPRSCIGQMLAPANAHSRATIGACEDRL